MKYFMYKQNNLKKPFVFHQNILQKIFIVGTILTTLHCFELQCSSISCSGDKITVLNSLLYDLYTYHSIKYIK